MVNFPFCARLWSSSAKTLLALTIASATQAAGHRVWPPAENHFENWVWPTLGARDFSNAVSGFCQVFIVTRARGFGLRPKMCRPSANNENSRRTREKPLVPRVGLAGA